MTCLFVKRHFYGLFVVNNSNSSVNLNEFGRFKRNFADDFTN